MASGRTLRLPLAKGAAERNEAEGFAPTEMRSDFKNCCFQIILPYPSRANPPRLAVAIRPPFAKGGLVEKYGQIPPLIPSQTA